MGCDAHRGAATDRRRAVRRRAGPGRRRAGHRRWYGHPAGRLMPGATLDAGALIALDRDDRRMVVLLARARETGAQVTVPAPALAQAIRRPERPAALVRWRRRA